MIAEKIHIYSPNEIDQIEVLSDLEICANYIFKHIREFAKESKHACLHYPNGFIDHIPIYCGERFNCDIISRVCQLLINAGWKLSHNDTAVFIHKSHFE